MNDFAVCSSGLIKHLNGLTFFTKCDQIREVNDSFYIMSSFFVFSSIVQFLMSTYLKQEERLIFNHNNPRVIVLYWYLKCDQLLKTTKTGH